MSDEKITVRVQTAGLPAKKVEVDPLTPVSSICGAGCSLIRFKENILCPAFTFKFYGIQDNDELQVLLVPEPWPRRPLSNRKSKRLRPERIAGELERIRLRDNMMTRVESSRRVFQRFLQRFMDSTEEKDEIAPQDQLNLEPAHQPREEALPVYWS